MMKSRRRIAFPEAKDRAGSFDYSRELQPAEWGFHNQFAPQQF
jgi:hypothetical protein